MFYRGRAKGSGLAAATTVAGAILMFGCGKTRNVIEQAPSAMGGDAGITGGGVAGTAGGAGVGGGSSGTAGQQPGVVTWDPHQCHSMPVPAPSDPTLKEQWTLTRAYCAALGKKGCLSAESPDVVGCTLDGAVEACVSQMLWYHAEIVASECESAWRTDVMCGTQGRFDAPVCAGSYAFGGVYGGPDCAQEDAALMDCEQKQNSNVQVQGSYAKCSYAPAEASGTQCSVNCQVGQQNAALTCTGPDGLPKQCACSINGHAQPALDPVFVKDCADAAQQAADGLCTGKLDCCFEYLDGTKQACNCVYPSEYGYDSCEAMMAVAQGRRVDICPGLLSGGTGEGCWPPGSCP